MLGACRLNRAVTLLLFFTPSGVKIQRVKSKVIIIIIERKDLGGVMSKDCKDTLQTLKTVTKRECDAK